MLEIKPIQDKNEQENICRLCGMEYDIDSLAYAAYVKGELIGVSQFRIRGKAGYLYDIRNTLESDDTDALFIMGRAVLNYIDLHGAHEAYFENDSYPDMALIKRIGFKLRDDGKMYMNLEGFFDSPCQHDKK